MPPTTPMSTPSGVTSPTSIPSTMIAMPTANSTIAPVLRAGRCAASSRERSTATPVASIGETSSTRREPIQEASQVVRMTATAGSATTGVNQP